MAEDVGFLDLIEIHERRWGTKQYPGRPTLKELMEYPIVAVWGQSGNFTLSAYQTAQEINQVITDLFTGKVGALDIRRLVKLFYKQQPFPFSLQIVKLKQAPIPEEPPAAQTKSSTISRFYEVHQAEPVRFGFSAPARNHKLPGRKQTLIQRVNSPVTDEKPKEPEPGRLKKFLKKLEDDGR